MKLRIVTYEGRTKILVHEFEGSEDSIHGIVQAHRRSDPFFRAATEHDTGSPGKMVTYGTYKGIEVQSVWNWSR